MSVATSTAVEVSGGGTFDRVPHEYRNASGILRPSVTQVIGATGLGVNLDGAPLWRIEAAGERGRYIHKALHFALEGDLDWRALDPEYKPVVKAGLRCLKEAGFELVNAEQHAISDRYGFGGTWDYDGSLYGAHAMIDAKSGSTVPIGPVGLQVSGYSILRAERMKARGQDPGRPKRYCLRLYPKRGEAKLIAVTTDPYEDEADFLAAVRVWHRKHRTDLNKEMR